LLAHEPTPEDVADAALLVSSLREAGAIARSYFRGRYASWDKGHGNPVTDADIAVDRLLHERLLAARSGYGWLSEETEDDRTRLDRARVFVVDPIDGTIGFLKGRPHFTIVAAVVENGRPVAAAIYNPISEEMFEAVQSGGARLNGAAIGVSNRATLEHVRMLAPRVYIEDENWGNPWPATLVLESRASIAYRLALVASGQFDAMLSLTAKHDWDLAAGDLIVNEAGGKATSTDGTTLKYNARQPLHRGIVAASPALHTVLLGRIAERVN
jgi:myo-inositol-1(or 4)-monophosphatase